MSCPLKETGKDGCDGSEGFLPCSLCGLKKVKQSDWDILARGIADIEDARFLENMKLIAN